MSGNSARSTRRTAPMVNARSGARELTTDPPSSGSVALAGVEHQPELPDLHLIAGLQRGVVDAFAVDVGAVEAAHVVHYEGVSLAAEDGVLTGHGHVVEEDVAIGVPPGRHLVVVQQEART